MHLYSIALFIERPLIRHSNNKKCTGNQFNILFCFSAVKEIIPSLNGNPIKYFCFGQTNETFCRHLKDQLKQISTKDPITIKEGKYSGILNKFSLFWFSGSLFVIIIIFILFNLNF